MTETTEQPAGRRLVKLSSLLVDVPAQSAGQWQAAPWPGVRFRVRSTEYEPYKQEREQEIERLAAIHGQGKIPDAVWLPVLGRLLARHILLEWDGLDAPYDADVARDTLGSIEGGLLRGAVIAAGQRVGFRDLEFVVQLEKNSAARSEIN